MISGDWIQNNKEILQIAIVIIIRAIPQKNSLDSQSLFSKIILEEYLFS